MCRGGAELRWCTSDGNDVDGQWSAAGEEDRCGDWVEDGEAIVRGKTRSGWKQGVAEVEVRGMVVHHELADGR